MAESNEMTRLMDALGRKGADAFSREFIEDTRLEARDALRAIVAAYDRTQKDGAKIPTLLMCAIEMGRSKL